MPARTQRYDFENGRGQRLAGRLELPPAGEPRAFALFAHCFTCSKDVLAASRISRALGQEGYGVLRFDFTGLGNSEGDFANTSFSSNVDDLVAAAESLRESHGEPQLLVGHSLGGAAVLRAAARIPGSRAVATIGAPSEPGHVRRLLKGRLEEIEGEGSADVELEGRSFRISKAFLDDLGEQAMERSLRELGRALLVLHSPLDRVVGIENARRLFEAALHPKSFLSLDGADHLLTRREDSVYVARVLAAWASRYVAAPKGEREGERKSEGEREQASAHAPGEGQVVVAEEGAPYTQEIRAAGHRLLADEPRSAGGADRGPSPYDLLLASLGACTSMTVRMYADRKEWPLERVAVRLSHSKIHAEDCERCETKEGKIDRIERVLEIEGDLDGEQRARLLEIANRCPVHRTLHSEIDVPTRLAEEE